MEVNQDKDLEIEPEEENEDDEDDELSYEELKQRMRKDRRRLRKMEEEGKRVCVSGSNPTTTSELCLERSRHKKLSRAENTVQKHMKKIMEVCKGKGFVYGIVPEKGNLIMGSSESLRGWWMEKVKFEHNAPTAISNYLLPTNKTQTQKPDSV